MNNVTLRFGLLVAVMLCATAYTNDAFAAAVVNTPCSSVGTTTLDANNNIVACLPNINYNNSLYWVVGGSGQIPNCDPSSGKTLGFVNGNFVCSKVASSCPTSYDACGNCGGDGSECAPASTPSLSFSQGSTWDGNPNASWSIQGCPGCTVVSSTTNAIVNGQPVTINNWLANNGPEAGAAVTHDSNGNIVWQNTGTGTLNLQPGDHGVATVVVYNPTTGQNQTLTQTWTGVPAGTNSIVTPP